MLPSQAWLEAQTKALFFPDSEHKQKVGETSLYLSLKSDSEAQMPSCNEACGEEL
jgi:hypothetical protein